MKLQDDEKPAKDPATEPVDAYTAVFNGKVGHDVDIAVGNLTLNGATVVAGDVLYRSGNTATIASTVEVASQLEKLPARGSWGVELVLTIATVVGFFGFLYHDAVIDGLSDAGGSRCPPRATSRLELG